MILEAIERVLILNFDILTPFGGVPLEKMHFLFVSRRFWMIRSDSSSPEDSNKLSAVAFSTECPNQQKIHFKFLNSVAILISQLESIENRKKLTWKIHMNFMPMVKYGRRRLANNSPMFCRYGRRSGGKSWLLGYE